VLAREGQPSPVVCREIDEHIGTFSTVVYFHCCSYLTPGVGLVLGGFPAEAQVDLQPLCLETGDVLDLAPMWEATAEPGIRRYVAYSTGTLVAENCRT